MKIQEVFIQAAEKKLLMQQVDRIICEKYPALMCPISQDVMDDPVCTLGDQSVLYYLECFDSTCICSAMRIQHMTLYDSN